MNKYYGEKFGRLTVVDTSESLVVRNKWQCLCECGTVKYFSGRALKSGLSRSCGCLKKETTQARARKHGKTQTSVYRCWQAIKRRCYNHNTKEYKNYGARGITVCEQWVNSFETFLRDMGEKPYPEAQIDRIDNHSNYEPSNCRWAAQEQNTSNRRTTQWTTYKGELITVARLAKIIGISTQQLSGRIKLNWAESEYSMPINKRRKKCQILEQNSTFQK